MSSVLAEISEWKLEAKFESSERYFYNVAESKQILSGRKFFVIGRKGSGKTAISEHIKGINGSANSDKVKVFSERLSFKGFPFNELYDSANNKYTFPNQYITIWKYVIYSYIVRMMARNDSINYDARQLIGKVYGSSQGELARLLPRWRAKEFNASLLGLGIGTSGDAKSESLTWIEKCDILEDFINDNVDDSNYYIVFDELDEDYKDYLNYDKMREYIALLTSLFKAVQDIRSIFYQRKNVFPVIFLRDDIYEFITDSDKTKWNDFRIDIDWNTEKIKQLLAFRLTRAIDPLSAALPFAEVWRKIFSDGTIRVGRADRNRMDVFSFIARSTHLRPRDFISYLQQSANEQIERNQRMTQDSSTFIPIDKIMPSTVKSVDKGFSNYLRSELEDEMKAVLPETSEIFSVISQLRKQIFTISEFRDSYNRAIKSKSIQFNEVDVVLKFLFHFSVIGNYSDRKHESFFRYWNREARLNFNEKLIIHRGLFKALQIDMGMKT